MRQGVEAWSMLGRQVREEAWWPRPWESSRGFPPTGVEELFWVCRPPLCQNRVAFPPTAAWARPPAGHPSPGAKGESSVFVS